METLLSDVKVSLRIVCEDFDNEIQNLINACILDLGIAGVDTEVIENDYLSNPLVIMAVTTYCKMNFGEVDKDVYTRLKASYDEQKAQLSMNSGYHAWIDQEQQP